MLEFAVAAANPDASVAAFLSDKRMLLVLDNCEHMVDAVAPLLETILRRAPHVSCLVTSREALRAEGEWVYRLRPIENSARDRCIDRGGGAEVRRGPAFR